MNSTRLRNTIVASAVVAVAVLLIGTLVGVYRGVVEPPNCSDVCDLGWELRALVITAVGVIIALVAVVLAAITAARRRDWFSACLAILQVILGSGAVAYLFAAQRAMTGAGGPTAGASALTALVVAVYLVPVSALLYGVLLDRTLARRIALSALAAFVVIAPLAVAPPWVVFNPVNGAPVLSINPMSGTVNCTGGPYPPITVKNSGTGTLQWTAQSLDKPIVAPVIITPSSGTLVPGASQTVTFSGPSGAAPGQYQVISVEFTSNAGGDGVVFTCQ